MEGRVYKIRNGKNYSSKKPEAGLKKDEPVLKQQYRRTAFLNELASEINRMIKSRKGFVPSGRFYQNMQARFRKEPINNRLLILDRLKGMEINTLNRLQQISPAPAIDIKAIDDHIVVELTVTGHALPGKHNANCYFFEVVLLLWDDSGAPCQLYSKKTSWIYPEKGYPAFDIDFQRPDGTTDYLVCVRESLGMNGREYKEMGTQGMLVAEVGSFNKKSKKLLEGRRKEILAEKEQKYGGTATKADEEKRIEPKNLRL